MAAGSVTVAALRHRPRQAVLVVALAAVVTAAASLGPLYSRAVEQSVLRTVVADAPLADRTLVVTDASVPITSPAALARAVRPEVPGQFVAPVGGADAAVTLSSDNGGTAVLARLTSRQGLCAHLDIAAGRCPHGPGEILVSRIGAGRTGLRPGSIVTLTGGEPARGGATMRATVVGLYDPIDATAPYWAGRAKAPTTSAQPGSQASSRVQESSTRAIEDVLTPWSTFAATRWPELRSHLDIRLRTDQIDLDGIPAVRAATGEVAAAARTVGATATSGVGNLLDSTKRQRDQARTAIPLLAVQLWVLAVVVLAYVCAAGTEARRPEIALARLRGHGAGGAAAMLLRELGLLVLAGTVAGAGLAWLVARAVAALWLEPGVGPEVRWPVVIAVLASLVAGWMAVLAAGLPTLRQPITSLLRRVPPRSSTVNAGLAEGAVAAAAAAGVVTLATSGRGPVALLGPGLLAVAGGLLLAQATIPAAGPIARLALRRGHLPVALAALQIARRPALRRLIAIVTVASALLVFAVDAWTVADRNRTVRARVEAGAPIVITVAADSSLALRRALLAIDPHGRFATPVVTIGSVAPLGPRTTAVESAAFARIAQWGTASNRPPAAAMSRLQPRRVAQVKLPGTDPRVQLRADFSFQKLERPPRFSGSLQPLTLFVVASPVGEAEDLYVELGRLRPGRHTYRADIACRSCTLSHILVQRAFGDSYPVRFELAILEAQAGDPGALQQLDLGPAVPQAWQVVPFQSVPTSAEVQPGPPLKIIEIESSFAGVDIQRGDRPAVAPALATGRLPSPFRDRPGASLDLALAPDLSDADHLYAVTDRIRLIPRSGPRAVLVDLATVDGLASEPSPRTSYEVWLATDDPARERVLRRQLADHSLQVVARDSTRDHLDALGAEGPALALRLALLAGVVAVVLAAGALVVGVATSGTGVARDLAGLRVVGVPAAALRAATVIGHLVVAVLGVLMGAILGLVAAQAALPDVPMFATRRPQVQLVLTPAWLPVLYTAAACLALLCAVSVLVGRRLAADAVPGRLREGR